MAFNAEWIKLFIDQHLNEVRTVHCVADKLGASYETMRKGFLRSEREPMADYITRKKVEEMKRRLLASNEVCYKICFALGYREDSGAKVFKRITGMTMQQYRRLHRV